MRWSISCHDICRSCGDDRGWLNRQRSLEKCVNIYEHISATCQTICQMACLKKFIIQPNSRNHDPKSAIFSDPSTKIHKVASLRQPSLLSISVKIIMNEHSTIQCSCHDLNSTDYTCKNVHLIKTYFSFRFVDIFDRITHFHCSPCKLAESVMTSQMRHCLINLSLF